jgi:(p)ppGpp synthase/HD superfamily hydrolase
MMIGGATYFAAVQFAREKFDGQFRRDGKTPYINHCLRVADRMETWELRTIGVLHDILEDTNTIIEELAELGISEALIRVILVLTHRKDEPYMEYLKRVSMNEMATRVKLADIQDNISDAPTGRQMVKYAKAILFLLKEQN